MKHADVPERLRCLTPTEIRIAELLAAGHTRPAIAAALGISSKTVDTHRSHIMIKLGTRNAVDLAHCFIAIGHVAIDERWGNVCIVPTDYVASSASQLLADQRALEQARAETGETIDLIAAWARREAGEVGEDLAERILRGDWRPR